MALAAMGSGGGGVGAASGGVGGGDGSTAGVVGGSCANGGGDTEGQRLHQGLPLHEIHQ